MNFKTFSVPALTGFALLAASAPSLSITQPAQIGDVNMDGTVNVSDATLTLRKVVGTLPTPQSPYRDLRTEVLGDANQDGLVNVGDATLVLRTSVGLGTLPT